MLKLKNLVNQIFMRWKVKNFSRIECYDITIVLKKKLFILSQKATRQVWANSKAKTTKKAMDREWAWGIWKTPG